jgi:hypothetical protein
MTEKKFDFKPTKSLLGFCGLDCGECKTFIATQNGSAEMKRAVAAEWSKMSNQLVKPDDVNCVGCVVVDGPLYGACAVCKVRTCGLQKKVPTCSYCAEYPCGKLGRIHTYSPKAKVRLDQQRQTRK